MTAGTRQHVPERAAGVCVIRVERDRAAQRRLRRRPVPAEPELLPAQCGVRFREKFVGANGTPGRVARLVGHFDRRYVRGDRQRRIGVGESGIRERVLGIERDRLFVLANRRVQGRPIRLRP